MSYIDEYLDEVRESYQASVYKCKDCGFRAFGLPVTMHEHKLKHTMERELPLQERDRQFHSMFD